MSSLSGFSAFENGACLPKDTGSRLAGDLSTAHAEEGVHSNSYKQCVFDNWDRENAAPRICG